MATTALREQAQAAWRERPARKQVKQQRGPQRDPSGSAAARGGHYNIWYHKRVGERRKKPEPATTRCDPAKDAGYTRARPGSGAYICYKFAKGCCPNSKECTFLHDLPDATFDRGLENLRDCFGRERFADQREDQGGVGCFTSDDETQRSLFIGGVPSSKDLERAIRTQFGEWGDLEHVGCFPDRGFAFVRYRHRSQAEFAKVAMAEQSLFGQDTINVRWAKDDPHQLAKRRRERNTQQQFERAALARIAAEQRQAQREMAAPESQAPAPSLSSPSSSSRAVTATQSQSTAATKPSTSTAADSAGTRSQQQWVQGADGWWYYWDGQQHWAYDPATHSMHPTATGVDQSGGDGSLPMKRAKAATAAPSQQPSSQQTHATSASSSSSSSSSSSRSESPTTMLMRKAAEKKKKVEEEEVEEG